MADQSLRVAYATFRCDAARWVRPQDIVPVEQLTPRLMLSLLVRHPPLRAMAWLRLAEALRALGVRGVVRFVQRRLLRVYGLELSPGTSIGGGLYIAHPLGCVLHAERIGTNVTIIGQVTFGYRGGAQWPVIGDEAYIGVGARVLGGIRVGDRAKIGANAVALDDVPDDASVVGIPARVVARHTGA